MMGFLSLPGEVTSRAILEYSDAWNPLPPKSTVAALNGLAAAEDVADFIAEYSDMAVTGDRCVADGVANVP
jgi:hypothetical protein